MDWLGFHTKVWLQLILCRPRVTWKLFRAFEIVTVVDEVIGDPGIVDLMNDQRLHVLHIARGSCHRLSE